MAAPILILAAAVAVADAILSAPPASRDPGFIDAILASRGVVASIRVALIFAAAYVVASTAWLMSNRRFLVRVGSVEVADQTHAINADNKLPSKRRSTSREVKGDRRGEGPAASVRQGQDP